MEKLIEKLLRRTGLPPEATEGALRVTISGRSQVRIEHHRGLLSYSDTETEVGGGRLRARIRGDGLQLRVMTEEELLITGTILGVELE